MTFNSSLINLNLNRVVQIFVQQGLIEENDPQANAEVIAYFRKPNFNELFGTLSLPVADLDHVRNIYDQWKRLTQPTKKSRFVSLHLSNLSDLEKPVKPLSRPDGTVAQTQIPKDVDLFKSCDDVYRFIKLYRHHVLKAQDLEDEDEFVLAEDEILNSVMSLKQADELVAQMIPQLSRQENDEASDARQLAVIVLILLRIKFVERFINDRDEHEVLFDRKQFNSTSQLKENLDYLETCLKKAIGTLQACGIEDAKDLERRVKILSKQSPLTLIAEVANILGEVFLISSTTDERFSLKEYQQALAFKQRASDWHNELDKIEFVTGNFNRDRHLDITEATRTASQIMNPLAEEDIKANPKNFDLLDEVGQPVFMGDASDLPSVPISGVHFWMFHTPANQIVKDKKVIAHLFGNEAKTANQRDIAYSYFVETPDFENIHWLVEPNLISDSILISVLTKENNKRLKAVLDSSDDFSDFESELIERANSNDTEKLFHLKKNILFRYLIEDGEKIIQEDSIYERETSREPFSFRETRRTISTARASQISRMRIRSLQRRIGA